MTIGQRIQELRKQAGLSQEGLGEALGVTRQAVSKWESDGGIPELDTLIAMSRLFGVTIGQLLGVEEQAECRMQEMQNAETAGLDEEQVEDILRRYVEETRQPPRQEKRRWKVPVITAAVLVGLVVFFGVQMGEMQSTIRNLNGRLSYLDSSLSGLSDEIGGMEYRIQNMLEEQGNPVGGFEWTVAGYDPEAGTVGIHLFVELKHFDKGTQTQFILTQTSGDGTETKYEDTWRSGPDFVGDATLLLDQETTCVLRVKDGDGVITRWEIEADFSELRTEEFELGTFSLDTLVPIQVGRYATVVSEIPSILIYARFYRPVSAELTVSVNGETRYILPLTLEQVQEAQSLWRGRSEEPVEELRLQEGDTVEYSITMEDELGRKTVETSTYVAGSSNISLAAEERHTSVPWE